MAFDEKYMLAAIAEAKKAEKKGECPIGAVIVRDGQIIARGHNLRETKACAINHAEVIALQKANKKLGSWRLDGCDLYVTLEPCAMCAGAMVNARVDRVVYGLGDPRCGACGSALDVTGFKGMLHNVEVKGGVLELECRELMQEFFRQARERSRSREQGAGK